MHNVIFSSEMASAGKQQHSKALEHSDNPKTKEKLYSCSLCSKSFFNSNQLLQHKKIHTGNKPHCCSECTKPFARLDHLKRHMRLHTGEKPYSCLLCTKSFVQASDLKKHVRTHTGEKPFSCLGCTKTFASSSNLTQHMKIQNSHWRKPLQLFAVYQIIFTINQIEKACKNSQ